MAQVDIGTILEGYDLGGGNPSLAPSGFEYLGNQYCFIHAGGSTTPNSDGKIHAFKSTNDGATWTEQDSSNAPLLGLNYSPGHCICRDGDQVYVIYVRASMGGIDGLSVVSYFLSDFPGTPDTWGTATDYFPLPHAAPNCPVLDFIQSQLLQICLVLRNAGDMILYFTSPRSGGTLPRVSYCTFDGSVFGSGVELPDQSGDPGSFRPQGAIAENAGITHFFYQYPGTFADVGYLTYHIAMDGSNAFGTRELVDSAGYLGNLIGSFSSPITFQSGGNEYICFAGLVSKDITHVLQQHRFFYAQLVFSTGTLTWHSSKISEATYGQNDPSILFWEQDEVQAVAISVSFLTGILVVSWTFTPWSGGPAWTDGIAYNYLSQARFGIFVWETPPEIVITTSQSFFEPAQMCSWAMPTNGKVGILSFSVGIGSPTTDQQCCTFNALVPSVPVSTGNRARSYYQ